MQKLRNMLPFYVAFIFRKVIFPRPASPSLMKYFGHSRISEVGETSWISNPLGIYRQPCAKFDIINTSLCKALLDVTCAMMSGNQQILLAMLLVWCSGASAWQDVQRWPVYGSTWSLLWRPETSNTTSTGRSLQRSRRRWWWLLYHHRIGHYHFLLSPWSELLKI